MGLLDTNSGEKTQDAGKDREWIDPLFSIKSLRDKNLVEYYCDKLAAQQNQITPLQQESEQERAKRDPYSVLTKPQ